MGLLLGGLLLGSGGKGGGGLTLGPPTNTFTAATQAAAEVLRDAYALANADWLAQYDAEPTFTIQINWPVITTDTLYQARRGGAWANVTGLIRGEPGLKGALGAQGRFLVFSYINAAVAPVAAPASTTFTRSTGTLVVPAGYTAIPATPAAGSKTYRSQAIVNPLTDIDAVALVWGLPAELPAYAAASLAVVAQTAAEAARVGAEAAARTAVDIPIGSPLGALIGTSPTLSTNSATNNTVRDFGATERWTVPADAPDDVDAGVTENERLYMPDDYAPGANGVWAAVEVDGTLVQRKFIAWGGIGPGDEGGSRHGSAWISALITGAVENSIQIRWVSRVGVTRSHLIIYGAGTILPADTVVKIHLAVVRGEKGDPGVGNGNENGGGGVTEARVQQIVNATNLSALQGQVTDVQVLAAITRDAELTAAITALVNGAPADRNTLNELSTAINLRAPLNSPALTGVPLAPTSAAGTNTTQIATTAYVVGAIAAAMLTGGADGVLADAVLQADGVTLRLTLSDNSVIDVNLMDLISGLISSVTANEGLEGGGASGDVTVGIADLGITYAKLAAAAVAQIRQGLALVANVAALSGATFTGLVSGLTPIADANFATKAYVDGIINPVLSHMSYVGVSPDGVFSAAEFLAGATGVGNALPVPVYVGSMRIGFARPMSLGVITVLYLYAEGSPNTTNQIGSWSVAADVLDIAGEDHYVIVSNNLLAAPAGYTLVVEVG